MSTAHILSAVLVINLQLSSYSRKNAPAMEGVPESISRLMPKMVKNNSKFDQYLWDYRTLSEITRSGRGFHTIVQN